MNQICPKCRKKIHYVTLNYESVVVCEIESTVVYTERGRRVEGYQPHICKELNNDKNEEEIRRNGGTGNKKEKTAKENYSGRR